MISDVTLQTLNAALRGLAVRRQAFQDNLANVETPGYLANRVSFESSLREALEDGEPASATVSAARSLAPTNQAGNNVAMDEEMVGLSENALAQQLVTEAMNAKYRLLRTAIVGQ